MPINDHLASPPRRGMIVRSKATLEPGTVLFKLGHRFVGSARQSDLGIVSSPWWFTQETAELICKTSGRSGTGLSDMFRQFGAIAKRWKGTADLVVKARVKAPLVAYVGPGTIQDFREEDRRNGGNAEDLPLWVPSPSVPQVHVSLMRRGDFSSSVALDALEEIHVVPLDKWDDAFIRSAPKDRWAFHG